MLNPRTIIDEPAGTGAHSVHAMLQIVQTWTLSDNFSIMNNTFYDYINRYNQTEDYYADTAESSFTLENKTDFKGKFALGPVGNEFDAGFTYRYAHVYDIQNYNNEPVSVFDLSQSPSSWVFPAAAQISGGAFPYTAAFGHTQYGFPGNGSAPSAAPRLGGVSYPNATIDSNLQDAAIFLEHRLTFSPQWSLLYGLRGDLVQLNDSDPLYSAAQAAYRNAGQLRIRGGRIQRNSSAIAAHRLVWSLQREHQPGLQSDRLGIGLRHVQQGAIRLCHSQRRRGRRYRRPGARPAAPGHEAGGGGREVRPAREGTLHLHRGIQPGTRGNHRTERQPGIVGTHHRCRVRAQLPTQSAFFCHRELLLSAHEAGYAGRVL